MKPTSSFDAMDREVAALERQRKELVEDLERLISDSHLWPSRTIHAVLEGIVLRMKRRREERDEG